MCEDLFLKEVEEILCILNLDILLFVIISNGDVEIIDEDVFGEFLE